MTKKEKELTASADAAWQVTAGVFIAAVLVIVGTALGCYQWGINNGYSYYRDSYVKECDKARKAEAEGWKDCEDHYQKWLASQGHAEYYFDKLTGKTKWHLLEDCKCSK